MHMAAITDGGVCGHTDRCLHELAKLEEMGLERAEEMYRTGRKIYKEVQGARLNANPPGSPGPSSHAPPPRAYGALWSSHSVRLPTRL